MRVLWCLLILLSVLAPAGQVGITQTPADAEQLTAPGTRSVAAQRKLEVDRDHGIQITAPLVELSAPPRARASITQQQVSVVAAGRQGASSASPRGPPV